MRIICNLLIKSILCSVLVQRLFGCLPDGASNKVTIGKRTYVCITLSPLNWFGRESKIYLKMSTRPESDELSRINVHNGWTSENYTADSALKTLNVNASIGHGIGITVQSMGLLSYQKAYRLVRNDGYGVTFPLMMAVIRVEKGVVKSIEWDDDGCSFCGTSSCEKNVYNYKGEIQQDLGRTCWLSDVSCHQIKYNHTIASIASNDLCELNVYVVWSGTDSNGDYFLSSTARFSRMSASQVTEYTKARKADEFEVTLSSEYEENHWRSFVPTFHPTTSPPTTLPTTAIPTVTPTFLPSVSPSAAPTKLPTYLPTTTPTTSPTVSFPPTSGPSLVPTTSPTLIPVPPTLTPTSIPSIPPTASPSIPPTFIPTSSTPTTIPTVTPTFLPSISPSDVPTTLPTYLPTTTPTISPTANPVTLHPSDSPTDFPSMTPTITPTIETTDPTPFPTESIPNNARA